MQSEQHIWHENLRNMTSPTSQRRPVSHSQTQQPALEQAPPSGDRVGQEAMRSLAPPSAPIMPQHQPLQPLRPSVNLQQQSKSLQQWPLAAPVSAVHQSQQHSSNTAWPQQPTPKLVDGSATAEMYKQGLRESASALYTAAVAPLAAGVLSEMPLERYLDLHAALERGMGRVQEFSAVEAAMFRVSDLKLVSARPHTDKSQADPYS